MFPCQQADLSKTQCGIFPSADLEQGRNPDPAVTAHSFFSNGSNTFQRERLSVINGDQSFN